MNIPLEETKKDSFSTPIYVFFLKDTLMGIALITFGSCEDIQSYIMLGKGLKQAGHDVRLINHDLSANVVQHEGPSFFHVVPMLRKIS